MPYVKAIAGSAPPLVWVLEPSTNRRGSGFDIAIHKDSAEGPMIFCDQLNLAKASGRNALVRNVPQNIGLPPLTASDLMALHAEFQTWANALPDAAPFSLVLRRKEQPVATGQRIEHTDPIEAIRQAMDPAISREPDLVIEWSSEHAGLLTMVDVDYHHLIEPPSEEYTDALALAVRPKPFAWWRSHGGGIHLLYAAIAPYTASELAACAAIAINVLDPTATVELLTHTRHPGSTRL
jgi:hypothetical protein